MTHRMNKAPSGRGRAALAATASLLVLAIATPVNAQVAAPDAAASSASDADIIVTGIRESLQRNLDIKRESSGVVDVISAEDIGKFPDSNVAASLQRLPGVSIQRNGSRGEPQGITVRGFGGDFNETPYSYNYFRLRKHFGNSFEDAGNGFGFSLNSKLFFLRIDHHFFSKGITPIKYRVDRTQPLSDHFPTRASYVIN